jgi:WD40 repeat protein
MADAGTGRQRRVLSAHSAAVRWLAFSPDGATLASVSGDRTAILWNLATGKARETLRGHAGSVTGHGVLPIFIRQGWPQAMSHLSAIFR